MALIDQMTDREKYRTRGGYYFLNRNYKQAVEEFSALIQQFPMDSAAHINLPLAYFYNGRCRRLLRRGKKLSRFAPEI